MASKLGNAFHELMLELHEATGMPDEVFTIVLTVEPRAVSDEQGNEGTSYILTEIVINEEMYYAKFD